MIDAPILSGYTATFPFADTYNRQLERDVSTGDIPNVLTATGASDFPRGGWQIGAVTQVTNFNAFAGFGTQRPNRLADSTLPASQRSTAPFCEKSAFSIAPQFTLGKSSRNPVRGPGYASVDPAFVKRTILRDRITLETRAEIFNLTKTPPLGPPNVVLGSAGFGSISSAGDPRVSNSRPRSIFEIAFNLKADLSCRTK